MEKHKIINNNRDCPLCGEGKKNSTIINGTNCFCNNCSLIYNSELKIYDDVKHWTNFTFNLSTHSYDMSRIKFFQYLWKYICRITKKTGEGRILDVGCGLGIILKIASGDNWVAEGIEISEQIVDFAKKYSNCKVYLGKIENLNLNLEYDFIFLIDTFRHLENPLKTLDYCSRFLKNNGAIIIRDLNAKNFSIKKRIKKNNDYDLQFLSKETAKKFLEKIGIRNTRPYPSPMSLFGLPLIKKYRIVFKTSL